MEINKRKVGVATVVDLKLDAVSRGSYDQLRQIIDEQLAGGELYFVVNLAECSWIDSMGIGELIRSMVHVMRQGGSLKLAGVPHKVKGILSITNLTQVFEIYDDETLAIESFPR
jgi:anti-sigma B factor antagonist